MKRKLTALLLTMCLLLTAFPLSAAAAGEITIRFKAGDEHVKGFDVNHEVKPEHELNDVPSGYTLKRILDEYPVKPKLDAGYEDYYCKIDGTEINLNTYQPQNGETILVKGRWKTIQYLRFGALGSLTNAYRGEQMLISVTAYDMNNDPNTIPISNYDLTMTGNEKDDTKIEVYGDYVLLTVAPDETAANLKIKAIFKLQNNVEEEHNVSVNDMPAATFYTGIEIEKHEDLKRGQENGFLIKGIKSPTQKQPLSPTWFNFNLTGNISAKTTIDEKTGFITVAKDELSNSLELTVTHKTNANWTASKSLPVDVPDYTLVVKPENPKVKRGESVQFSAYANYTNGDKPEKIESPLLTWEKEYSADNSVITPEGLFTYAQNQQGDIVYLKAKFLNIEKSFHVRELHLESIQIAEENSHSAVNPGGELQFKVTGKDNFNEDVEFAPGEIMFELIAGGTVAPTLAKTSEDTRINPTTGKLAVGRDELKDILTVKASHAATGKSVQMPINVNRGAYTLKLKPQNATIAKGESKQFTAYVVEGSTEVVLKPTDLIWKAFVDTAEATQSAITVNGVFTYGAAETATEVAIKATLKYDLTKMANAVVKLGASSTPPLNGYDNGNSSNNSSNNSSSNTGGPAAPAPQQPKKAEDNKPKPQDKKMDKTTEIIGRFKDIAGHWAQKAIVRAVEKGIFKGVAENSFAPDRQMSRAEFITVLGRMSEQTAMLREAPFKDIDANAYYAQHVAWGAALGLMKGFEDGTFRPEAKITREQAAVIFANFLKDKKLPESPVTAFGDEENISGWAKEAVKKAAALGLLKGKDGGRFAPKDVLTRAEMAQILDNLSNMLEK